MNDNTLDILEKFSEVLEITNPITFMLRWIGWIIIKGLAWLVDSLASITDSILGLKLFFQDSEITNLVEFLLPLSVTLMAFSLAYTGYMLVFQKKTDREGIIVNIFMALVVLGLLGTAMDKANHFTDEAISVLDVNTTSSISEKIVKDNLNDIAQYDLTDWTSPQLEEPNKIPENRILKINITEAIDEDFKISSQEMSQESRDILSNRIQYDDVGSPSLVELDNGWFTAFKEKYYRWDWNFWTIAITLGVMAFTMLTIAIKMAKLFFELAFNYVLASIIAPADIHSGQKTKQVIQNILNIFVVTIMIFLSLKIYMIGTNFITQNFQGVAYLIALFAFSLAVIDGPNIVERLFGIDAGLKSGWSALAGSYALTRGATSTAKGAAQAVKGISSATKSAGVKGMGGLAGVAGMAQGLRTNTQHAPTSTDNNNTKSNGNSSVNDERQNPNSFNKEDANSQELNENNAVSAATSEPTQDNFNSKNNEESPSGSGSSLEEEMQNQNQKQDEQSSANAQKYQGLHEEMGSKKGTLNTRSNVSRMNNSNRLQPTVIKKNDHPSNQKKEDYPSKTNNKFSGRSNQSNRPGNDFATPAQNNLATGAQNSGTFQRDSRDNNLSKPVLQEKENRHLGQVVSDNFRSKSSVKSVKRTYEIGRNTGVSLKKNIADYREKYRRNNG